MSAQIPLSDGNVLEYLRNTGVGPFGSAAAGAARVEPVGDGNINWVRRVRWPGGSLVVKQARPELERFPEYSVSTDRIAFEARFYSTVRPFDDAPVCPGVVAFDPEQCVLVLEDLGDDERLDAALARGADVGDAAAALGAFLGRLHRETRGQDLAGAFDNDEMRRLHGDHIFRLPYRDNDFPLSEAVAPRAAGIRSDAALIAHIDAAYERYLEPRGALVHGDVQPSNVILGAGGPRLLDAEIAHVGDPAFDLGQLVAHLLLPGIARGEPGCGRPAARRALEAWRGAGVDEELAASERVARYAGIEMLRRTIGAARVDAVASDAGALAVLDAGCAIVRGELDPWGPS